MPQTLPTGFTIAAFAVFFPLFWLGVIWLISRLGGWHSLTGEFGANARPQGETFTWITGKFSLLSNYSHSLNVTVSSHGIHIQPMLLFRVGHAPLFFPWTAVGRMVQRRFIFGHVSALHLDTRDGMHPVTLYGRHLSEALAKYAPGRLSN